VKFVWDENAWADYLWWQTQDRKVLKRINTLLQDVARTGNEGIGKPEPLKHGFQGYWSRRITDEHRLIYKIVEDEIRIAACRYHYGGGRNSPAGGGRAACPVLHDVSPATSERSSTRPGKGSGTSTPSRALLGRTWVGRWQVWQAPVQMRRRVTNREAGVIGVGSSRNYGKHGSYLPDPALARRSCLSAPRSHGGYDPSNVIHMFQALSLCQPDHALVIMRV
jgi:toxin YoeB